jgi:hypothetical protein
MIRYSRIIPAGTRCPDARTRSTLTIKPNLSTKLRSNAATKTAYERTRKSGAAGVGALQHTAVGLAALKPQHSSAVAHAQPFPPKYSTARLGRGRSQTWTKRVSKRRESQGSHLSRSSTLESPCSRALMSFPA